MKAANPSEDYAGPAVVVMYHGTRQGRIIRETANRVLVGVPASQWTNGQARERWFRKADEVPTSRKVVQPGSWAHVGTPADPTLTASDPRHTDGALVDLKRLNRLMSHRDHGHDVLNDGVMTDCELTRLAGGHAPKSTPEELAKAARSLAARTNVSVTDAVEDLLAFYPDEIPAVMAVIEAEEARRAGPASPPAFQATDHASHDGRRVRILGRFYMNEDAGMGWVYSVAPLGAGVSAAYDVPESDLTDWRESSDETQEKSEITPRLAGVKPRKLSYAQAVTIRYYGLGQEYRGVYGPGNRPRRLSRTSCERNSLIEWFVDRHEHGAIRDCGWRPTVLGLASLAAYDWDLAHGDGAPSYAADAQRSAWLRRHNLGPHAYPGNIRAALEAEAAAAWEAVKAEAAAGKAEALADSLAAKHGDDVELMLGADETALRTAEWAAGKAEAGLGAPARKSTARLVAGDRVHAKIVGTGRVPGIVPAGPDAPVVMITSAKRSASTGGRAVYVIKIRGAQTTRTGSQMWTLATTPVAPAVVAAATSRPRLVTVPLGDAEKAASVDEAGRISGVARTMSRVMWETLINIATLGTAGRWPASGSTVALMSRNLIGTQERTSVGEGIRYRVRPDGWAVLASAGVPASWRSMVSLRVVEVAQVIHDQEWAKADADAEADLAADNGECPHCGMDFIETETDGDVRRDHVRNCMRNPRGTGLWRTSALARRIATDAGLDPDTMTADEFEAAVRAAAAALDATQEGNQS